MRYIYSRLLLCLLLCLVGNLATVAQVNDNEITSSLNHTWTTVRSTQGRDFFVTFMMNAGTAMDDKSLALQLRVATMAEEANVTIEYRYGSSSVYKETFKVYKDSVYTYSVPENRRQYAYALDEEKKGYKSVRVVSDKDISVYACNYGNSSYDATMVLPIQTLGNEYVLQTFLKDRYATEFAIVATDPTKQTTVYITPSVLTSQKNEANKEIKVKLAQGQVYFVRSNEGTGDFSGTKIWADAPVAVFSGNQATSVPFNPSYTDDHIFEQVIPLRYWGQHFAVTTAEYNTENIIRVTAIYDDTEVKVIDTNGTKVKTLKAYESYAYTVTGGSAWVETSRPTICYQYLTSALRNPRYYNDDGEEVYFGDPSMVYIAPIEQGLNDILISAFTIEDPDSIAQAARLEVTAMRHYVNVVTKTSAVSAMRLNGKPVSAEVIFTPLAGNAEYSYAKIPIVDTISYLLSNAQAQFTAIVYGLANAESYAYNAGFNNRYNDFYMFAGGGGYGGSWGGSGGIGGGYGGGYGGTGGYGSLGWRNPDQNRIDYMQVCLNEDPIEFRSIMIADGTPVKWDFGDGTILKAKSGEDLSIVNHKYEAVGRYTVVVTIEYESVARPGSKMSREVSMIVDVIETVRDVINVGICKGEKYDFKGRIIDSDSLEVGTHVYVHNGKTAAGCDHITTLNMYVGVPTTENIDTTVCPFDVPYVDERFKLFDPNLWYKYDVANGSYTKATDITQDGKFTQAGIYRYITECEKSKCDSTIIFSLSVMPDIEITVPELSICQDSALAKLWIDPTFRLNLFDEDYPKHIYQYNEEEGKNVEIKTIRTDSVGTFSYTISNHCDTTWYLQLKVTPTYEIYDTIRICDVDTISWQNILYVGAKFEFMEGTIGAARDKYDKLIQTSVDKKEYQNIFKGKTLCCSECDSIRHLRLFLQSTDTVFKMPVTICSNEKYTFEGEEYTYADVKEIETRTHSVVRTTATGCEYIEAVRVTIHPTYTFEKDTVVFEDSVFIWRNHENSTNLYLNTSKKSYNQIATAIQSALGNKFFVVEDRLKTQAGCDSLYILNVTVAPTYRKDTTVTICDNGMLMWRGNMYVGEKFPSVDYMQGATIVNADSSPYAYTIRYGTNKYDADSIYVLNLTVNKTGYELREESVCNDETAFEFGGKTYDLSQYVKRTTIRLTHTSTNFSGCESTVDLDLTINPTYAFDEYATVFQYAPYTWGGHEHVVVSTATFGDFVIEDRQTSQYGCDSVYYLHLHVDPTYMYWTELNLCDIDTLSWQNRLYVGYKDTLGTAILDPLKELGTYEDIIYLAESQLKNKVYYDTVYFKTKQGADSTFYLALSLKDTYTRIKEERTICSFDELEFAGKTYDFTAWPKRDTTIVITDTFATKDCGCDSVVDLTLHIHPNYLFVTDTAICQNEITKWRNHYNINEWATGVYYDSLKTVTYGCDSVYQLNLTIQPAYMDWTERDMCTNDTVIFHGIVIAFDTTQDISDQKHYYEARYARQDGDPSCDCDSIYRFIPKWKLAYHYYDTVTVCSREVNMDWHGQIIIEPGDYIAEYKTNGGCDSIYELAVVLEPTYHLTVDTICQGAGMYSWVEMNREYVFPDSVNGWFVDTLSVPATSHNQVCDDIYELNLYIAPTYYFVEYDTICEEDLPYIWHYQGEERKLYESNTYYDDLMKTTYGCDSSYVLHLHVNPIIRTEDTLHFCAGDSIILANQVVIKKPGVYSDTLQSRVTGCDSIVSYIVVEHPIYQVNEKEAICYGSDWTWHNRSFELWSVGKYLIHDTLYSEWGCDSIISLQLMIIPSYHIADSITIEPSETYNFRDVLEIDKAGVYYDSLHTTLGCDSVFSVHVSYLVERYDTICQYESFLFNDTILQTTGIYYDSLLTVDGFDSVYIQYLQVNPKYRFMEEDTICRGEVYDFRGQLLTEPGVYHDSLMSSGGCDSIYQLRLVVLPSGTREFYDEYCNSETYVFLGDTIELAQFVTDTTLVLYDTIYDTEKCDSIDVYYVIVRPTYHYMFSDTVAHNTTYQWLGHEGNRLYSGANQYTTIPTEDEGWISLTDSLHTIYGCDSVWTLNLYVAPTYLTIDTATICFEEVPYLWRGRELRESGMYYDTVPSRFGTDSVCQLQLYVRDFDYIKRRVDICEGDTFYFSNGFAVEPGIYMDTVQGIYGCNSIIEYAVVCRPAYNFIEKEIICHGAEYTWNAHSFTGFPVGVYELTDSLQSQLGCDSVVHLQLFIAPDYHFADTVTIEPGEIYNFYGRDIDHSGVYYDSLMTRFGCDSVYSVYVSYLVERYDTICENEIFEFQGMNLFKTGVYYDSLMTTNGFDSVYIQHLQVNPKYRFVINDTICRGEVYDFRGQLLTEAGVYHDSLISSGGCDSLYQLHLVVHPAGYREVFDEYCNSEKYVFLGDTIDLLQFVTDTTLILYETIHNTIKCDSTIIYHIKVNPTYHFVCSDTIGVNHPYSWIGHEGHTLYQGDNQFTIIPTDQLGWISINDSLRTINGCDSIWTLNLYVAPTYLMTDADTICYNDRPYIWRGRALLETGVYNDTLYSQYGTDSIYQMELYVRSLPYLIQNVNICDGDSFVLSNSVVSKTGVYFDTLKNDCGCDSIVEYRLTVREHYHFLEREVICVGDDYIWRNYEFINYSSGLYEVVDSMTTIYGCDSIYTLQLVVAPKYNVLDSVTICVGETYDFRGKLLTEAGWYYDTVATTLGCDSICGLYLSYLCASYDTICMNEYFDFRGQLYQSTGVYYDSLKTIHGYDSVFVEYLQVNPRYRFIIEDTICYGDVYDFRGQLLTKPGVYNDSLISSGGCDSIYQLHLVVHPAGIREVFDEYCNSEEYVFLGDTIDLSQFKTDTTLVLYETIHNTAKCDSTIIYHIKVNPTYHFACSDTIGINHPYSWIGHEDHTLYQGGNQFTIIPTDQLGWISINDSLRTVNGCDSIWTLNLYVAPTYSNIDRDTICFEDAPYLWRGREIFESGIYSDTLQSIFGTDSIFVIDLMIRPLVYTKQYIDLCRGDSFRLSNQVLFETGIYFDTLTNIYNCDSIIEYTLKVHEHYHFIDREAICEKDSFEWRGHKFVNYSSGRYEITDSLVSLWGCDSVYTLQLVISPIYHYYDSAEICIGDVFNFRGQMLTQAGWYHDTLHTTVGCDSIYSMYLSYLCVSYDTICGGDVFDFNGRMLSETGVYYDSLLTKNGSDSILVEYLFVDYHYSAVIYDTICSNEWYSFNGMFLNEAAIYYDTLSTIGGCDSIQILNLHVLQTTQLIIYDTLCIGDSYVWHNQIIAQDGVYVDTTLNENGCLHIEYLYLTQIKPTQVYIHYGEFCEDNLYFEYVYEGRSPIEYSIKFSDKAKEQGFLDYDYQTIEQDGIVSVPYMHNVDKTIYPRPGDYEATIFLHNGICSDSLIVQEVSFKVKYPSWILEQHWNDVISILVDSLNGGYIFSEYQWYYNGQPMFGENKPYLYVYPSLDMQGEYAVEVTRVDDGEKIMTCPIYPEFVEDHTLAYEATVVITPTSMTQANPNCMLYCDQDATWYVYTADGVSVQQGWVGADVPVAINLPAISASYFVFVRTEKGYVKYIKLIVY